MTTPTLNVKFYRNDLGKEPVCEWRYELSQLDRKMIGDDIKTVQFGWPLGMPLVRKLKSHLWEVRIQLVSRIARVIFTVDDNTMVLLHAFIKKSQATLQEDLALAVSRLKQARS